MFKLNDRSQAHLGVIETLPSVFSAKSGAEVNWSKGSEPGFEIRNNGKAVEIKAATLSDYFRALGELALRPGIKALKMSPQLSWRGVMIDCSRNGVLRPEILKRSFAELALLGYNKLCLYTEDTYEVKGQPLIGYRRGRYSQRELRDLDRTAAQYGIEMFPCIQVLGHLSQILKFPVYWDLRDTENVLNVRKAKVYKMIEKLIKNASAPYASRAIHLGMDETWDLGRGVTFDPGKPMRTRKMYIDHVHKVTAISKKLGLKPLMWGDMLLSKHLGGKDASALPKDMQVVYWNYYSEKPGDYRNDIKACRAQGFEPIVAPGCWNWDRFWGFFPRAEKTAGALLSEAKKAGVQGALMTLWGDDGAEAPFRSNMPALTFFAQHCWRARPAPAETRQIFERLFGSTWASFAAVCKLDAISASAAKIGANASKAFIFDDLLQRLYASHARNWDLDGIYAELSKKLFKAQSGPVGARNRRAFGFGRTLASCLELKAGLGNEAYRAYHKGDRRHLKSLLSRTPELKRRVRALWKAHRAVWLEEKKPFGMETLDQRYGGVLTRIEAFESALSDGGRVEEFEEKTQEFYQGKFPAISAMWRTHKLVSSISTGM